jgi:hypothetical protein
VAQEEQLASAASSPKVAKPGITPGATVSPRQADAARTPRKFRLT